VGRLGPAFWTSRLLLGFPSIRAGLAGLFEAGRNVLILRLSGRIPRRSSTRTGLAARNSSLLDVLLRGDQIDDVFPKTGYVGVVGSVVARDGDERADRVVVEISRDALIAGPLTWLVGFVGVDDAVKSGYRVFVFEIRHCQILRC
jgi:hypothetical protein